MFCDMRRGANHRAAVRGTAEKQQQSVRGCYSGVAPSTGTCIDPRSGFPGHENHQTGCGVECAGEARAVLARGMSRRRKPHGSEDSGTWGVSFCEWCEATCRSRRNAGIVYNPIFFFNACTVPWRTGIAVSVFQMAQASMARRPPTSSIIDGCDGLREQGIPSTQAFPMWCLFSLIAAVNIAVGSVLLWKSPTCR